MSDDVESKLEQIFLKRSGIDFALHPELKDAKLLGREINVPARELVHIYFDIKTILEMSIPEEIIIQGKFDTYNHIKEIPVSPDSLAKLIAHCTRIENMQDQNLIDVFCKKLINCL